MFWFPLENMIGAVQLEIFSTNIYCRGLRSSPIELYPEGNRQVGRPKYGWVIIIKWIVEK
jgi:hypothetical protein